MRAELDVGASKVCVRWIPWLEVSRTLVGMGVSQAEAQSAIRVSFGQDNTREEVDRFVETLGTEVADLRRLARTAS